ncbi:MAG TPA: chemotaxis protein CheW, partial [Terriglobales bacterium]
VHEIVRIPDITAVPDTPEFVQGVINLRGRIVPVVDLRKRFGEQPSVSKKNRILVAEVDGKLVGLIVDAASEVFKLPRHEIEAPPNMFEDGDLNYVTGVGKWKDRLVILVDVSKVLQKGELRRIGEFSEVSSVTAAV